MSRPTWEHMTAARRWLLWESQPLPGKKPRKVPYYVDGGTRVATDTDEDSARLVLYEVAKAELAAKGPAWGLGFALGPDGSGGCWQGVDLDDIAANGLGDLANTWERSDAGYIETSPSGNGLHVIGYGRSFEALGSNSTGIEAYAGGRFFTVSERQPFSGPLIDLADYVAQTLAPRHRTETRRAPLQGNEEIVGPQTITDLRSALAAMPSDDRDLWVRMGMALKTIRGGYGLWTEWSQKSVKYDPADAEHKWSSFGSDRTSYRAVFKEAQERWGWVNPTSNAAHSANVRAEQGAATAGTTTDTAGAQTAADAQPTAFGFDPFADSFTMAELRTKVFAPLKWIVDGFIPEGLTVFAGMPKVGKSFMQLELGFAVTKGGLFLGARCQRRRVLYLSLEDGGRRLQERSDVMLDEADPGDANFHVVTKWRRLDQGGLEDIRAWCDRYDDLGLVMIDTRAAVDPEKKARGGNAYEQDYAALAPLQQLSQERRIGILATTHLKKASVDSDLIKQVTGSMGVTGTADSILILGNRTDPENLKSPRALYIRGRDVEENQYYVERDGVRWKLSDVTPEGEANRIVHTQLGALRLAIVEALQFGPLNKAELAARIHGPTKNHLKVTLWRMVQAGQINHDSVTGQYSTSVTAQNGE